MPCIAAGSYNLLIKYTMRILCYHSYADDDTCEQLYLLSEWVSTMPLGLRFYIREDRASFALLIDSYLKPVPLWDYYV